MSIDFTDQEFPELDDSYEPLLYALEIWTAADTGEVETIEDDDGIWRVIGSIRYYPELGGFMDRRPRKGITEEERGILRGAATRAFWNPPNVDSKDWSLHCSPGSLCYWVAEISVRYDD
ncbi:hypothetical protein [Nocardia asiatica]|uniref:hypothetical protein n=1 Tax=Nocardia asiatica TaxID=209252 RepID=UPI0024565374|nr:hypothetical protein [Nocardia asiatica]